MVDLNFPNLDNTRNVSKMHFWSSSLYAICSQQVGCHGSPSFSILCHSDTVIIWHFCPFLDVIRPHCSRSPSSSSTIYPSFHQQSLYPISSYYMSKILTFPFFDFDTFLIIILFINLFTVKVLEKRHIIKEKKTQYVHREKEVFAKLDHPFFVKMYFTFQDTDRLCILSVWTWHCNLKYPVQYKPDFAQVIG